MTEPIDLETVLADMRAESDALERAHAHVPPARIREWADAVERAAEEWLTWLSEGDAATRAGKSEGWVRSRFELLRREGHARLVSGRRQYRACFIPRRANVDVAAERGREAARAARDQQRGRKSA